MLGKVAGAWGRQNGHTSAFVEGLALLLARLFGRLPLKLEPKACATSLSERLSNATHSGIDTGKQPAVGFARILTYWR